MEPRAAVVLFGALLTAVTVLGATERFVAPDGNDGNPGTRDAPFATLARAREALRQLRQAQPTEPVTVSLRGGLYRLTETLQLTAADAGTEKAPVTWQALPGETVRILGGVRLTGWQPVSDPQVVARLDPAARGQVQEADLKAHGVTTFPPFDPKSPSREQVFCNGKYMALARYPNDGWLRIADVPQEGELKYEGMHRGPNPVERDGIPIGKHYGRFVYDGDRPARWQPADDIWMHGYWWEDYQDEYQRLERLDTAKKEIWPAPPWPAYGFHKRQRYCFLNVLEELDQPGEWYLDRKTGKLYLWPPAPIATADVTFPELKTPLISLSETQYVRLRGLRFECARSTAVAITGGAHNEVAGCTVLNVGDTAISIDGGTDNGVRSCDIYEVGSTGISLNGGDRKTLTPSRHYAENCHLHDFARVFRTYRPGVQLGGVGQRVSHCYIHDAPHAAICYGGNDHVVEYCEFTRTGLETGDVGVIYTAMDWTNMGEIFRYNYFHHIRSPDRVSVGHMTIYLDLPCGGVQVYGNVFYDVPRAFFSDSGRGCVIENNVFIKCTPAIQFYVWEDPQYFKEKGPWPMVENLKAVTYDQPPYSTRYPVLQRLAADFALGDDRILERQLPKDNLVRRNVSYGGQFLEMNRLVSLEHVKVEQNLIADPVVFSGSFDGSGKSVPYANGDPQAAEVLGKHGNVILKGDPGFADVEAEDFTLKPDSPAWKLGFEPIPFDQIGLQVDEYRRTLPAVAPVLRPSARVFVGELPVTLTPARRGPKATLRYTLDGSDPSPGSPEYSVPLSVTRTTTVKAAAFTADGQPGECSGMVTATYTAGSLGDGGGVYLSDLEGTDILAYDALKRDTNLAGGTIVLAGREYRKGLMLCPKDTLPDYKGGLGHVTYVLDGGLNQGRRFRATIGIEDTMLRNNAGSATFAVEVLRGGTWERAFASPVLRLGPPQQVDADITGAEQLRLITTDGGDNIHCDHAVWAEARIQ